MTNDAPRDADAEWLSQIRQAAQRAEHDDECWYCKERCNSLAGNPGLWPLLLPLDNARPGYCVAAHTRCVLDRLKRADDLITAAEARGRAEGERAGLERAAQVADRITQSAGIGTGPSATRITARSIAARVRALPTTEKKL